MLKTGLFFCWSSMYRLALCYFGNALEFDFFSCSSPPRLLAQVTLQLKPGVISPMTQRMANVHILAAFISSPPDTEFASPNLLKKVRMKYHEC